MGKVTSGPHEQRLENRLIRGGKQLMLLPILGVLFLYLLVNYFTTSYSANIASDILTKNLQNIVKETNELESQLINQILAEVARAAIVLQEEHEKALATAVTPLTIQEHELVTHAQGSYLKPTSDALGFVFFKQAVPNEKQRLQVQQTASLMSLYKNLILNNPVVEQVYFLSTSDIGRIYPFRAEQLVLLENTSSTSTHPFLELIGPEKNPGRKYAWTDIYIDKTALGWMLSALTPVYLNDELVGAVGLDVTLKALINEAMRQANHTHRHIMLLDSHDNIIAMTDSMAQLFYAGNKTEPNQASQTEVNLRRLKDNIVADELQSVLLKKQADSSLTVNDHRYLFSITELPDIDLRLISLSDTGEIESAVKALRQTDLWMLFICTGCLFLITLLVLKIVLKRLKYFAAEISAPIAKLSEHTSTIARTQVAGEPLVVESNIAEIAALVDNFNTMNERLAEKVQRLHEADAARLLIEEKARMFQVMANTDALTGLNNRKFVDSLLRHEAIRANRTNMPLSLIIMDIDHFKRINDTFGHQTGDLVLKRVAKALKNTIRSIDCVGRWGGEEFLLVCPETSISAAIELAERIRKQIESLHFEKGLAVTISCGVAGLKQGERTERTIARADEQLYQAKRNGRNRVEYGAVALMEDQ